MLKERRSLFEVFFISFDVFLVSFAWLAAYWFRFYSGLFSIEKGIPSLGLYFSHLWLVCLVWIVVFKHFGMYKSQRFSNWSKQLWLIIKACTMGIFVLLALTYLGWGKDDPFSRLAFGWFWVFSIGAVFLGRIFIRGLMSELRRQGFNIKYAVLVGEGDTAIQLTDKINSYKELGYEIVGILVSSQWKEDDFYGLPVLGKIEDLTSVIASHKVDTVFITLPLSQMQNVADLVEVLSATHVDVKIIPDIAGLLTVGGSVEEFEGMPVISLQECPIQGGDLLIKRTFDILLSGIGLVLLSPLLLIIALLVKLTSRGPILYKQERVTLDGTRFFIYKFRTMYTDAEKSGPGWTVKDDPRVTPIGRFLRRWSLDELPQLWNVLVGDMSLVGPRPERPFFIKRFRDRIPSYMLRHKVPAGLTGLAQIHGLRGDTSIEERLKYDLLYIKNWSILLDIKIIILTLLKGLRNNQA